MHVAYLVNQYPKVSHSFIRREILGLEKTNVQVSRYSIRSCEASLVDQGDQAELTKTRVILDAGVSRILYHLAITFISRPLHWLKCFKLMLCLYWASDRSFLHHVAYMAEACVLLSWFTTDKIEHVHAHFGTNPTTVALLCKKLGGPTYSFTVHGPEEFDMPSSLSLPEKIKQAAFVVAVSSFGQSQLYRWCDHNQWAKIHVVHCGVDDEFLSQKNQISVPVDPILVCVGRLSEQKGHFLLLEAAKQLAESGKKFQLRLVGDGPLRPQFESFIERNDLQHFVKITGWASGSEVREQILNARTLVLPSFAEGLPVVIMESLALGRPVISTYIAGIPELLESGVCGWLIPSGSIEALINAMTEAIQLPLETLNTMGQAGALKISRFHRSSLEAEKLATLFLKVNSPSHLEINHEPHLEAYGEIAY